MYFTEATAYICTSLLCKLLQSLYVQKSFLLHSYSWLCATQRGNTATRKHLIWADKFECTMTNTYTPHPVWRIGYACVKASEELVWPLDRTSHCRLGKLGLAGLISKEHTQHSSILSLISNHQHLSLSGEWQWYKIKFDQAIVSDDSHRASLPVSIPFCLHTVALRNLCRSGSALHVLCCFSSYV